MLTDDGNSSEGLLFLISVEFTELDTSLVSDLFFDFRFVPGSLCLFSF